MKRYIELHNRKIEYTLRTYKRSKHVRLLISRDGCLTVTAPKRISMSFVERFVLEKSQWVIDKLDYFRSIGNQSVNKEDSRLEYGKHKELALEIVKKKLDWYNLMYGFSFRKVSIRNQKTRWGSCSRQRNLSFNYKIILIPEKLADYIIVHELCHLKEFNHSQKFWSLVSLAIPDYKERRRELNSVGIRL